MGTKTEKFNLNQIVATDTPDWLTTYNEDMAEIERRGLDKATYDPTGKNTDAFRADSHVMTGYVRPTEPETIRQTDTVSSAIGKLETRGLQAGDMRKNTYDKNDDGKVDAAEYADVAGSIPWDSVQGRPTTLPNDNAITVKFDGVYVGKYDGSAPLDVNVEADAIGAASLVNGKVPIGQLPASDAIDSDSISTVATSSAVKKASDAINSLLEDELEGVHLELSTKLGKEFITPEMHRMIFRGKNLGTSFTSAQRSNIQNGTFDDLFLGDYWEIGNVHWRIVDINYWYNCGDIAFTQYHLVIMPDVALYAAQMNPTDTTDGGYANSQMRQSNLAQAEAMATSAFGNAVLTHRELLTNAVTNGYPSAGGWVDSSIELPNEIMMYGSYVHAPAATGTVIPYRHTVSKTQLALMTVVPRFINLNRQGNWLRDVVSATYFADVFSYGNASFYGASDARGVRPVFPVG